MIEFDHNPRDMRQKPSVPKFKLTLSEFLGFSSDYRFLEALYKTFKVVKFAFVIVLVIAFYLTAYMYVHAGVFITTRLLYLYGIVILAMIISRWLELYFKFKLENH